MSSTLLTDLQREVRQKRVLVIVGAGVSVGATAGTTFQQRASWRGLLSHGIERSIEVVTDLPSDWATRLHADLNSPDLDDLLSVAERVSAKLGAPSGGEYRRWLRDAFEAFVAAETSVLEALHDLELPLATTNYDGLLEQVSNYRSVTWRDPGFERVMRGDENGILHLHGYWKDSESVVLGIRSYERLLADGRAQSSLRALRSNLTLLFVGFGEGLEDPNFNAFLKWSREVFSESEYRHFRLCREQELSLVQKRHPPDERIFALAYGNDYKDLGPFLRRLKSSSEGEHIIFPSTNSIIDIERKTISEALGRYRRALSARFSRWDIGPVESSAGGLGQTLSAELDTMYLPLRLSIESERIPTGEGVQLLPEELLQRGRPLVIRGPGGAGKTTWMRWTFRKLLKIEDVFPVFIQVRDVAIRWGSSDCQGSDRSILAFIRNSLAEYVVPGIDLWQMLATSNVVRSTLFVDGWDEIGPLGDELRSKLIGLIDSYPTVRVVVTSRPYGVGRPSNSDGFEVCDIQPLSDDQIREFARRFFLFSFLEDEGKQKEATNDFLRALDYFYAVKELARTPLLLTMLLLVSRSRPLPVKRHMLFEQCIETLLHAVPDRRAKQGALPHLEEWSPDDIEETFRVVAKLAYEMSWQWHEPARPRLTWGEVTEMLPSSWPLLQRQRFLRWLCDSVGLLRDAADGSLSFVHYSLQEFLVAWHLNAMVLDSEARIKVFLWGAGRVQEVLLLWAALIARWNPDSLEPILLQLNKGYRSSVLLAGYMYCYGLGSEGRFLEWLDRAREVAIWEEREPWIASESWRSSREMARKEKIAELLVEVASTATWPAWSRIDRFNNAGSFSDIPWPRAGLAAAFNLCLYREPIRGANSNMFSAMERILTGIIPAWPEPMSFALLHVWPARRRFIGYRLQLAALCGFDRSSIQALAGHLFQEVPSQVEDLGDILSKYGHFTPWMASSEFRDIVRDWAVHELPGSWRSPASFGTRLYWPEAAWRYGWGGSMREIRDWAEWRWNHSRDYATSELLAREFNVPAPENATRDFVLLDIATPGRSMVRAFLAHQRSKFTSSEAIVLAAACGYSLHPEDGANHLEQELESHGNKIHPLWMSLARHVGRQSSSEDRSLLAELAQFPEKCESPLSWGLQFVARGDIVLDDGSLLTLDELTDELSLPRLAYLEEMPEDLPEELGESSGAGCQALG